MDTATATDLHARIETLGSVWHNESERMTPAEKHQHINKLKGLLQELHSHPSSTAPEGAVLKIRGQLPHGTFPTTEELNAAFALRRTRETLPDTVHVEVQHVFLEDNFNFLRLEAKSHNHLLKVREAFAVFGSEEQAEYVLSLGQPVAATVETKQCSVQCLLLFERPAKKSTRETYSTIGTLLQRLRTTDAKLRALGAVPFEGTPFLPTALTQTEDFDKQANECIMRDDRLGLHHLLVSKVRVDRAKRQAALDKLLDERIYILLQLCSYDQEEVPFEFEREFQ
jgi:hypothetical protein